MKIEKLLHEAVMHDLEWSAIEAPSVLAAVLFVSQLDGAPLKLFKRRFGSDIYATIQELVKP